MPVGRWVFTVWVVDAKLHRGLAARRMTNAVPFAEVCSAGQVQKVERDGLYYSYDAEQIAPKLRYSTASHSP